MYPKGHLTTSYHQPPHIESLPFTRQSLSILSAKLNEVKFQNHSNGLKELGREGRYSIRGKNSKL